MKLTFLHFWSSLLSATLLLVACSDSSSHRAGATTETTNGIQVAVHTTLPSVVQARLVAYSSRDLRVLDTQQTDSNGLAYFQLDTADAPYHLEVIAGADSAHMAWIPLPADSMVHITLQKASELTISHLTIPHDSQPLPSEIALSQTPYKTSLRKTQFHFSRIPAGTYTLVIPETTSNPSALDNPLGQVTLQAGQTLDTLLPLSLQSTSTLLEDFDDGDAYHRFASSTRSYGWYLNQEQDAQWISPTQKANIPQAIFTEGAWSGRSLRLEYDLGTMGSAQLGTHLGLGTSSFNLSALKSIQMRLRGDGLVKVALEQPTEVAPAKFNKALWQVFPDTDWKLIELLPENVLVDSTSYQLPFEAVADSINILTLFLHSGSYLEIDDIVLVGVDPQIFKGSME